MKGKPQARNINRNNSDEGKTQPKNGHLIATRQPVPHYTRPPFCLIEYKNFRFLITDRPTNASLENYVKQISSYGCTDVVRVCEPNYEIDKLLLNNIAVLDLPFPDGGCPPVTIIRQWFQLLKGRYKSNKSACVAVHCVSGLGRAPVMVAITLMELGLGYLEAVSRVREKRHGALNSKQLDYLAKFRPSGRLKTRKFSLDCFGRNWL
ncbi:hypothetical protein SNEBB_006237 [Seison nebaliae]|nr:hypothetical protein SNEBB_006237 [Seison nebaliae]